MSKQSRRKSRRHHKPGAKPVTGRSDWYWAPTDYGYEARYGTSLVGVSTDTAPRRQRTKDEWDALVARVQEKAGLDELGLVARHLPNTEDVRIYNAAPHRVAIVSDNRAAVEGHGRVHGDFLGEGDHWDRLQQMLAELKKDAMAACEFHTIADEQLTAAVPPDASPEMVERVKQASRVIWERFHALACPIELPGKEFSIMFWPATEHNRVKGLPFEYRPTYGASTHGRLCLFQRRDRELIPIAAASSIGDDELWRAWVVALCELARFVELAVQQRGKAAEGSSEPGKRHLRAVSSAFVGAFVRRLPDGQNPTPQAIANAQDRGVVLKDGETLVTEYVRHGTKDSLVRIDGWTPSVSLGEVDERLRPAV